MAKSTDHIDRSLRKAMRVLRHNSRRVARVATRFNRLALYMWDLLIWSRVEAALSGLISLDLPPLVLVKKGVSRPPPTLRVRATTGRMNHFNDGFAAVYAILFANLQPPDHLSEYRYALPGPAFRGIYLWDSAFIAQIWRSWDRTVAADVLRSVVSLRDGDRLQHFVADFVQSEFTQPPLLAWSLAVLAAESEDEEHVLTLDMYEALCGYHRWLRENRQTDDGLYAWRHPYESGIDNSPRFATRDESQFERTIGVAAPDFCTYMVLQAEALAALARRLGREEDAGLFVAEADALREKINCQLWHAEDGLYYDRDVATGAFTRSRTIASLLPLWAGIPDAPRAKRLCDQAMNPHGFGTLIPLPSVSRGDPAYEPDMWRGPVWINTAYAVILGLRRYGFLRETAELTWRLCEGVYRVFHDERQIYEFYDPDAWSTRALGRKRGNWWKLLTLGGKPQREFVGWSGLVNPLVIDVLMGFVRRSGRRTLQPAFPPAASGTVFRMSFPSEDLMVEIAVETPDRMHGIVQGPSGLRTFKATFAETVDLDALLLHPTALTV